jgi:putative glutamine amidotransferase
MPDAANKNILIGLTQRVTFMDGIGEKRDSLAQDWGRFMAAAALPWVALPNRPAEALALAERLALGGLILTGGDDSGVFPERDDTERQLLAWAEEKGKKVLGVCRGFQMIHLWLGGRLQPADVSRHVRQRHALRLNNGETLECNSFHSWGIAEPVPSLQPFAVCPEDKTIEAARNDRVMGLMWHPEREPEPRALDINLFVRHFTDGPAGEV